MQKRRSLVVLAIALAAAPSLAAQTVVRQWEVVDLPMTATQAPAGGYLDSPVAVRFTGTTGDAKGRHLTVAGFWDGGKNYRVRFTPPAAGEWSYSTSSRDAAMDGIHGIVQCQANPDQHGFVRVARKGRRAGRYFEYDDGTPFLWIGDTWWNWSKKGIHFSTFQKLVDDRAAKGFSVGQLFFPGPGLMDLEREMPDIDQIRNVERLVAYANSKGIAVWIHPWWGGKGLKNSAGPDKVRRWWRYVIARLGAYNVIWVLAAEYNMDNYSGLGLPFWKDLGAMVRRDDPYAHIIGVHPTPPGWGGGAEAPQWSTGEAPQKERWLDFNQSQVGHGKWRNEMIPVVVAADYARKPAKPIVVTEPWYEFIEGNPKAADVRYGAWSAMLSGAAGHTYGGGRVWWANVPEAPADQGTWPVEPDLENDTLDYPGAASVGFMARFLRSTEWWTLEPHPELVSNYAARFCSAVPGRNYVVYLRWGGAVKVDLRPSSASDVFRFTWIDLAAGKEGRTGTVEGGGKREFHAPEDYPRAPVYKDWVLHIVRAGAR